MPATSLTPAEQKLLGMRLGVEQLVAECTYAVSQGQALTDGQMRSLQIGTARLWGVRERDVIISHHGIPVLAPTVDLTSLPRELRTRPELYLHATDRALRPGETLADYAERTSAFLVVCGFVRPDPEGALRFAFVRRELNVAEDEVWDRFVAGDAEVVLALTEPPMMERLGREIFAAVLAASEVDSREFVGPLVKSWLSQISEDVEAALELVTSEVNRLLELVRHARELLEVAAEAPGPQALVDAEGRCRPVCDSVARAWPSLVEAYLTLAVPLSRASVMTPEQIEAEMAPARTWMLDEFRSGYERARGDTVAMLSVAEGCLARLRMRVDGVYQGDGPSFPKIPLALLREYCMELRSASSARRERAVVRRPEGRAFPTE